MLTLGIETSCDETSAAVVENGKRILSNIISSSSHLHKEFGGIVPEIATRYHVELITYCIERALSYSGVKAKEINLIAVTYGPGLVGALLIGISIAKAMSFGLDIPLVGVNHLRAHIYGSFLEEDAPKFPFIGLVISGGHTNLVYVEDFDKYEPLGQTRDDAVGEAFDKVAKILGEGFPGGPIIDKLAKKGNPKKIIFPRTNLGKSLDFSFSGLKTAVLYYVRGQNSEFRSQKPEIRNQNKKNLPSTICHLTYDIAASFQEAVIDILIRNLFAACEMRKTNKAVIGGGVSANSRLRKRLEEESRNKKIKIYFPNLKLCLDNAAMVAGLGYQIYRRGTVSNLNLTAMPNLGI